MTSVLSTLDKTGDTRVEWDPAVEGEVAAARATYTALKDKGYMAYKVDGDRRDQIHAFDAAAERIVMVRPTQGG